MGGGVSVGRQDSNILRPEKVVGRGSSSWIPEGRHTCCFLPRPPYYR